MPLLKLEMGASGGGMSMNKVIAVLGLIFCPVGYCCCVWGLSVAQE